MNRLSRGLNGEGLGASKGRRVIDLEKRKRVMARSMRLGHCICDPKKPCPCDVFRQHDLCPCAGEKPEIVANGPVRLTQMVHRPGCASKIDAAVLRKLLVGLPEINDPRVLIGMPAGDDAGVYQLDDNVTLVQTVDVFSPSVDDPYMFGQVAAANSVSDVYAMGGRPLTALSIVGFPIYTAPDEVLQEILRGGIDKMNEAGVAVIGGHSINDNEIKAGFAVTGVIHRDQMVSNAGLQPGDRLILTKPLGTGVLAFAAQIDRAPEEALLAAAESMTRLNRTAAELMVEFKAHACTDVTGFGLMGHLASMAAASKADVEIVWDDLPVLPGVLECLAEGIAAGAVERNREASGHALRAEEGVSMAMLDLCFDPQTSGGLLIAVPEAVADKLLDRLHEQGVTEAVAIGTVRGPGEGQIFIRTTGARPLPERKRQSPPPATPTPVTAAPAADDEFRCCPEGLPEVADSAPAESLPAGLNVRVSEAEARFQAFMQAANAPGALDARTKQAMAIALSVVTKCEPCLKSHIKKARAMGFSQEEIDEAAWMGISFGGAPLMMFYKPLRRTE
ncbi:MAG: selenide, water dikinase SelD [Pirellulales bacterium]|nr:selenide, water dikinase SelD [Pirellulales bacterium]